VASTTPSYALRFISGKYQGGEFPLVKGREIVIGRSSELDMVLIEDMVSRRHAKIQTTEDEIAIMDMGSTNGTFVNGEKVKKARLKEGDRILIGTSIMKLVTVDPATTVSEAEARNQLEKRGQQAAMRTQVTNRAMSGNIEEIPLPDLLQLFSTSKRTGVLTLKGPQGSGEIYLRKGQIYFATIDDAYDLSPLKAAYRILTWEKGAFELDSSESKTVLEEITESTEGLLMEGMRLLDEFRRVEPDLPPRKAPLQVPRPLTAPLSALKHPELDVFQIVLNGGTTQTVLDKAKLSDYEAGEHLINLIKREYIVAR
jgi:pSer/pThr/pTyr-binding forkhead associated (FHA) protein